MPRQRNNRLWRRVLGLHQKGLSLREVGSIVNRSPSTVKWIVDRREEFSPDGIIDVTEQEDYNDIS